MLILHLFHPIFPSTVSRATWGFTSEPKLPLEELFHHGVVTGCHKTWANQWEVFWMGFQLWHLIPNAAFHPSSQCCSPGTSSCWPTHLPALFVLYHDNFPRIWGLPSAQMQPPSGCHTTWLPPRAGTKPNEQNHFELCPATHQYWRNYHKPSVVQAEKEAFSAIFHFLAN